MKRSYTSINLTMSEIDKNKTDEYKLKNLMDGKNMEYIKTEGNEKENDMPIYSSLKNIFSQYPKDFPYRNEKINKNKKDYKKKEKEERKQHEDSLNIIYEDNKIINNDGYHGCNNNENNEHKKQKYLSKTTSFYLNKGDILFDKNNMINEIDNKPDLNDKDQKQKKISKKLQIFFSKKNKNKIEDNSNNNNDETQNKSIVDNKYSLDLFFEKEPDDIKNYTCYPLFKIKNKCNPRGNEWALIPEKVAPNQLKQETRNCYMVSALESMSQVPFLFTYIFEDNFSSYQYKFKLTFKRKEIYIVLNNFPVEEGELKFMKPLDNEAYAIIFEKGWDSKRGGYNKNWRWKIM